MLRGWTPRWGGRRRRVACRTWRSVPRRITAGGAALRMLRGWSRQLLARAKGGGGFHVGREGLNQRPEDLFERIQGLGDAGEILGGDLQPGGFGKQGPIFHEYPLR